MTSDGRGSRCGELHLGRLVEDVTIKIEVAGCLPDMVPVVGCPRLGLRLERVVVLRRVGEQDWRRFFLESRRLVAGVLFALVPWVAGS